MLERLSSWHVWKACFAEGRTHRIGASLLANMVMLYRSRLSLPHRRHGISSAATKAFASGTPLRSSFSSLLLALLGLFFVS